jgi:hypothetical protein
MTFAECTKHFALNLPWKLGLATLIWGVDDLLIVNVS